MADSAADRTAHHMEIPWTGQDSGEVPASAGLPEKAALAGRTGLLLLSAGAGAWRVRESMNVLCRAMGISCTVDIGLLTLNVTFLEGDRSVTQSLTLKTAGVDTDRLAAAAAFVRAFPGKAERVPLRTCHDELGRIEGTPGSYRPWNLGLAAALACGSFTFLLGGGLPEMLCAAFGAGVGSFVRARLAARRQALVVCVMLGAVCACLAYIAAVTAAEQLFGLSADHRAGYICAMLFLIPGFPLVTGLLDVAKIEMRSGLERLAYALLIITTACVTGWLAAHALRFAPADFPDLGLGTWQLLALRLLFSFTGVYGFSLLFNSPRRMAAWAGAVGMVANTLRLTLAGLGAAVMPAELASFCGALTAGLLAAAVFRRAGFPRVTLTVPSIVIMIPGLYMYRGVYNLGLRNVSEGLGWLTGAGLAVLGLAAGLVLARILTDREFRTCS